MYGQKYTRGTIRFRMQPCDSVCEKCQRNSQANVSTARDHIDLYTRRFSVEKIKERDLKRFVLIVFHNVNKFCKFSLSILDTLNFQVLLSGRWIKVRSMLTEMQL